MYERFGLASIGQVDLGMRLHRHHRLETLAIQAAEVSATLLARVPGAPTFADATPVLRRKSGDPVELNLMVRPPVASLARFGVA